MKIKTFMAATTHEIDERVNSWLFKNDSKIKLHDIKFQYSGYTGKLLCIIIYNHYSVEEIED